MDCGGIQSCFWRQHRGFKLEIRLRFLCLKTWELRPIPILQLPFPLRYLPCSSSNLRLSRRCSHHGRIGRKIRFSSLMLFIVLFSLFIHAPLAHWTWHPWRLSAQMGRFRFCRGNCCYISASPLWAAQYFWWRKDGEESNPTNVPYILLGTGLLWFGWFGFNGGSALAANEVAVTAFINTNLASATAMLTSMLTDGEHAGKNVRQRELL